MCNCLGVIQNTSYSYVQYSEAQYKNWQSKNNKIRFDELYISKTSTLKVLIGIDEFKFDNLNLSSNYRQIVYFTSKLHV